MGDILNHPIVVNSSDEKCLTEAREKALEIFSPPLPSHDEAGIEVTPIYVAPLNGEGFFFIIPDGSKVGWEPAKDGRRRRDLFAAWLTEPDPAYPDERLRYILEWAELQMGGWSFGCGAHITRSERGKGLDAASGPDLPVWRALHEILNREDTSAEEMLQSVQKLADRLENGMVSPHSPALTP